MVGKLNTGWRLSDEAFRRISASAQYPIYFPVPGNWGSARIGLLPSRNLSFVS